MKSLPLPHWNKHSINHSTSLPDSADSRPRSASKPPLPPTPSSLSSSRANSFFRHPLRLPSQPSHSSLHSAYSATAASTASVFSHPASAYSHPSDSNSTLVHPYAAMANSPLPVVSSRDNPEDEDSCPVCLEPLSFSFRLPGEKPHIVPECGHALHEACFSAVYGPPPVPGKPRKTNVGLCGVCRKQMKVGDGGGSGHNKLAALTGMGDRAAANLYPGRDTPSSHRAEGPSSYSRHLQSLDPTDDDPIEHSGSVHSMSLADQSAYIVSPSIQVRPEFSTITRTQEPNQPLTCIVVIELPSRRANGHVPGPVVHDAYSPVAGQPSPNSAHHHPMSQIHRQGSQSDHSESNGTVRSRQNSLPQSTHPSSPDRRVLSPANEESVSFGQSMASSSSQSGNSDPFREIMEDLRTRILDWKGHHLSSMGPLQMFDLLSVRRDFLLRSFFVYLFKEAVICVEEEKKKSLGRFLQGENNSTFGAGGGGPSKGVLKLKGRIYIRHIKHITDTSAAGELSLTIDMEDKTLESFILIFKDRPTLEAWKTNITSLVAMHSQASQAQAKVGARMGSMRQYTGPNGQGQSDLEEFGGSSKAMRMLSGSTSTTMSSGGDSLLHNGSIRSSQTSQGSMNVGPSARMLSKLSPLGEDEEIFGRGGRFENPSPNLVSPHMSYGPSNALSPIPHSNMDLIVVVSLPPLNATPATAALKMRVIKTTLDFIIASMGTKDRLSLVTFEVGLGGRVRKTPFLMLGRGQSRARLMKFVNEIGQYNDSDEFLVRSSRDEKTDVVTAVNHGLDVVLQRKSRNPVCSMLLVSDASDSTRRAQMDLVLARAEAANMPIHSFGYGRAHDPASLWLISNHTGGTYTFVKDWYDLRECLAGCVGGLMSIGILHMRMHLKVLDGHRFRIRKVSGGPTAIVASDGRDVDVEIGEIRYGERKEMLIELELDNTDAIMNRDLRKGQNGRVLNATDQFVQKMGLDSLSLDESGDFADGMMDHMIDEVPVFEIDGSFMDPAVQKHVSRLAHPVLLTVTLMPSSGSRPRTPAGGSDSVIVRRRMELLASDMITRALVLVSRKNYPQAQKILAETRRILHTVLQSISQSLPPPSASGSTMRNRKEQLTLSAVRALQAVLTDLQVLSDALDDDVDLFAHDQRNFGAQQAMILRDQKSWTGRTPTEKLFWTTDNSIELVSRSTDWVGRE